MINPLPKIMKFFSDLGKNDPVRHCRVYRTIGCSHVDGYLCDPKTCNIKVSVEITPSRIIEIKTIAE